MKKIHEKLMSEMQERKEELLSMGSSKGLLELADMETERGDSIDIAEAALEKEHSITMHLRSSEEIKAIDDALGKLHSGQYGICDDCEENIESKRLKASPYVKFCLECQEKIERTGGETISPNLENFGKLDYNE